MAHRALPPRDWPSARSVRHHFGTFTAAVTAAGLLPRPQGLRQTGILAWQHENRDRLEAARISTFTGFGPATLPTRTRAVARAAGARDPSLLRDSLIELAASALKWADHVASQEADVPVEPELAA